METIDLPVSGGKLVGWRSGSGRPALVLHGGPGAGDMNEGLVEELDGLYECVRYHQRGLAPSDAPGPYSVDIFVADVIAVLDALGWNQATLIGHSWGGLLAQHVAAGHPGRVEALIGICTLGAAGPDGGWSLLDSALEERLPKDLAEKVAAIDKKLYAGEGTEDDVDVMLRTCWPYYFADPSSAPPFVRMTSNSEVYSQVHASALEQYVLGHPEAGLKKYENPALFISAAQDVAAADPVRATVDFMPNGKFVLLENCGHFPWLEQPGAIRAEVEQWLT